MKSKFIFLLSFIAVIGFGYTNVYADGDAEGERIVFLGELPSGTPESQVPVVEAFVKPTEGKVQVIFNESVQEVTTTVTKKSTGEVVYKKTQDIVDSQTLPITIDKDGEEMYTLDIETSRGSVQGDFSIGIR